MSGSRPSRIASAQSDVRRWQRAAIGARPDTERFATILEDRSSRGSQPPTWRAPPHTLLLGPRLAFLILIGGPRLSSRLSERGPRLFFEAFPAKGCDVDHTWRTLSREQQ